MTRRSDEDLDAAFGYFEEPETLKDVSEKIDRLELEIWSIRDRVIPLLSLIFLSMMVVIYKLFNL